MNCLLVVAVNLIFTQNSSEAGNFWNNPRISHLDFVLARSWLYDKTDEARLLVENSNMLSLG